jgi:hypothetical protein
MPVRITAKCDAFRRCGVDHTSKPVTWPDDKFTPAQLKQLQAEPMLIVDIVSGTETKKDAVSQDIMLGQLIAGAPLTVLRLARAAINERLVDELDVPGLLALRAEITDELLAQGYVEPEVVPVVMSIGDSPTAQPETVSDPEPPETELPVKPASDDAEPAVKSGKKSGK